ncbi:MAG: primosomal protein N' [Chloroflexi bacterium]|nr:primosomal protein N' [Chloroflexota bacterium]
MLAEVIVPIKKHGLDHNFTYRMPENADETILPGSIAEVPFKNSKRTGWITQIRPEGISERARLKRMSEILWKAHATDQPLISLARKVHDYYSCLWAEVLNSAFPIPLLAPGAGREDELLGVADYPSAYKFLESKKAPKQRDLLSFIIESGGSMNISEMKESGFSNSIIDGLRERSLLCPVEEGEKAVQPRLTYIAPEQAQKIPEKLLEAIIENRAEAFTWRYTQESYNDQFYRALFMDVLNRGKGGIILFPEKQAVDVKAGYYREKLGDRLLVWDPALPRKERFKIREELNAHPDRVVMGTRSAVMLPLSDPGIIIVHREEDPLYKQQNSPRYHARQVAVMRASLEKFPVILSGPALSLESYYWTVKGKYSPLGIPSGEPCNISVIRWTGGKEKKIFSPALVKKIEETVGRGESVLLFHNRKGYSYSALCEACGYMPVCPGCNAPYKFHLDPPGLFCYRCGREAEAPEVCPECGSYKFLYPGVGSQRVAKEANELFPGVPVFRHDGGGMRDPGFDKPVIAVGTQAVLSEIEWSRIGLCAVPAARVHTGLEDFRASEKALQVLFRIKSYMPPSSEMFLQVFNTREAAWMSLKKDDPSIFYREELAAREQVSYPPFSHLVNLVIRIPGKNCDDEAYNIWRSLSRLEKGKSWKTVGYFPLGTTSGGKRFLFTLSGDVVQEITSFLRNYIKKTDGRNGLFYKIDVDPVRFA